MIARLEDIFVATQVVYAGGLILIGRAIDAVGSKGRRRNRGAESKSTWNLSALTAVTSLPAVVFMSVADSRFAGVTSYFALCALPLLSSSYRRERGGNTVAEKCVGGVLMYGVIVATWFGNLFKAFRDTGLDERVLEIEGDISFSGSFQMISKNWKYVVLLFVVSIPTYRLERRRDRFASTGIQSGIVLAIYLLWNQTVEYACGSEDLFCGQAYVISYTFQVWKARTLISLCLLTNLASHLTAGSVSLGQEQSGVNYGDSDGTDEENSGA